MNSALSLLVLVALSLSLCGCDTLVTRRSMYQPKKGEGYWTRSLEDGTWKDRGVKPMETQSARDARGSAAPPAAQ